MVTAKAWPAHLLSQTLSSKVPFTEKLPGIRKIEKKTTATCDPAAVLIWVLPCISPG
jgi:hypothetical protein